MYFPNYNKESLFKTILTRIRILVKLFNLKTLIYHVMLYVYVQIRWASLLQKKEKEKKNSSLKNRTVKI